MLSSNLVKSRKVSIWLQIFRYYWKKYRSDFSPQNDEVAFSPMKEKAYFGCNGNGLAEVACEWKDACGFWYFEWKLFNEFNFQQSHIREEDIDNMLVYLSEWDCWPRKERMIRSSVIVFCNTLVMARWKWETFNKKNIEKREIQRFRQYFSVCILGLSNV